MGTNKFEQELKRQLEKRQIQPSKGSWEKLNARLESKNKGVDNQKWWFCAAAAAVAAVMISVFLFNQDLNSPEIVDNPVNEQIEKPSPKKTINSPVELASEEMEKVLKSSEEKNNASEIASAAEGPNPVSVLKNEENIVLKRIALAPPLENDDEFSEEIEELLATVNQREETGVSVTDAEIDRLLAEAAAEIQQKESIKTPGIDAEKLLAEVEDEIYQSFKEKIFIVLKVGFVKARTAVANRNK